jgi:uncharacterized spore protein YtfJ
MADEIQRLFEAVDDLKRKANVNAAFGRPVVAEGRTLIPVAEVGYAFGMGFGTPGAEERPQEEGEGAAGGGGVRARPLGVVEVTPDGIHVEPVVDEQKVTLAGTLLAAWVIFWIGRTLVRIFGKR